MKKDSYVSPSVRLFKYEYPSTLLASGYSSSLEEFDENGGGDVIW